MLSSIDFLVIFFFFKQKTAYEMRISDWSSDVCSSDLMGLSAQSNIFAFFAALRETVNLPHWNRPRSRGSTGRAPDLSGPRGPPLKGRAQFGYPGMPLIDFTSMKSLRPNTPPSRPLPDAL